MVRSSLSLLLFALLVSAAAAQETRPFVESIEVRVVNVDVVVTDAKGNPIPGLTTKDFELYEDGNRVEITNFSRIVDGKLDPRPVEAEAASQAPPEEPERSPVTWAVFLDQSDLAPGRRNFAIRELRKFLDGAISPGDRGIVAAYDGRAFRIHQGFTTDRRTLFDAVARLEKLPVGRGPMYLEGTSIRADIQSSVTPDQIAMLTARISWLIEEETTRTKNAILNLRSFVDVVASGDTRVAVIYVGAGFNTLPGLALYEAFARRFPKDASEIRPSPEEQQHLLDREMARVIERLAATRAVFYSIHAADRAPGISSEEGGSLDTQGGIEGDRSTLSQGQTTRSLADRTGGRHFGTVPGLATQLEAVARDLDYYYSLGYTPKGDPGRRRDLRVEVKVPGVRVRHREAARERAAEEEAADAVVAALFAESPPNPLGVTVVPGNTRTVWPAMTKHLEVSVKVPLAKLTFLPDGKMQRAVLTIHFALAGEDGSVWRLASREVPLDVPQEMLATARTQHVSYNVEVPMDARDPRLAVSVYDKYGAVRSVVNVGLGNARNTER